MRLCAEIIAERVIQLQQDRDHHREQRAIDLQISMFEQQSVHFRMAKFNSQLPSLQVSACVTCSEKFPSLNVRTVPLGTGHTVYVVARTSISLNCTPQATTWIQVQYRLNSCLLLSIGTSLQRVTQAEERLIATVMLILYTLINKVV